MSLNRSFNVHHQSGISIAILLFIIIILGLLALTLVNLNNQSAQANAQQVIATRAFFAAESGAQRQAMAIFPIGGGSSCSHLTFNFSANGLNGCSATTQCNPILVNGETYFQVISQGQCNAGHPLQSTRTIEVRLKNIN